ncbi:TadE/TadG family type IV pilus assembly protein [Planctomycetota bacterium]
MNDTRAISQPSPTHNSSVRRKWRRGVILIWTAIFIGVLMLFIGLGLDWGKVALNVHQIQNAVDAASLAGAQIVKTNSPGATILRTYDFALKNWADRLPVTLRKDILQTDPYPGDDGTLDIILGRWVRYNRTFVATLDAPNAVRAIGRRNAAYADAPPLKLIFGGMVGIDTANAVRDAVAWDYSSGGAGLICLSAAYEPGLVLSGTGIIDVDNGGIHVNSTAEGFNSQYAGTYVSGGADIDCGFINTVGSVNPPPESSDWADRAQGGDDGVEGFSASDMTSVPAPQHMPDPLAAQMTDSSLVEYSLDHLGYPASARLRLPALLTPPVIPTIETLDSEGNLIAINGVPPVELAPGYYPGGISLSNGGEVTLKPTSTEGLGTLFIFGGGPEPKNNNNTGLYMTGGKLVGHGVTCYVTYNFDTNANGVTRLNGGEVDVWSPGDWQNNLNGTEDLSLVNGLNGIAIWQDPAMVNPKGETPEAHLNGNVDVNIRGTIYLPDPIHVQLDGTQGGTTGNQILCGSATILGTAEISVDYDQRNFGETVNKTLLVK